MKPKIAVVLGIRPDVIRASLVLNRLRARSEIEVVFIWSGQHYSDNLKDIFFRELGVAAPEVELGASGNSDAEVVANTVQRLYAELEKIRPAAVVFLGDTNTVMGCLAAAQLNIPILHIEGCMRSYDWRMPEEKYRTTIDHLSDVIYTYFDEYKKQGVAEGLNPKNIVVVQNLIVDVLKAHYFDKKAEFEKLASPAFFSTRDIEAGQYYVLTWHRRENVHEDKSFAAIRELIASAPHPVYFPASYRTQKVLKELGGAPANVHVVDPVGYKEFLVLMTHARGVITDSGTVVEETSILGVPTVQMRHSTERPQVYDAGGCVKFDPTSPRPAHEVYDRLEKLRERKWKHTLGDGRASDRIVNDIVERALAARFGGHGFEHNHLDVSRALADDGL